VLNESAPRRSHLKFIAEWSMQRGSASVTRDRPIALLRLPAFFPMRPAPTLRDDVPTLDATLDKTQHVHDVVEECATELATVNEAMRQQLDRTPTATALDSSLAQCETIEEKVQVCADELTQVNEALSAEIEERQVLEQALATARAKERAALQAALHDPLTGLPNRMLFNDRIAHGIEQARRHRRMLAVMFIDLDAFKSINDTHGHDAGDRVLQMVATRLQAVTRAGDTVSRHGGDEFVHLLPELKQADDAVTIARKIVAAIGEPFALDERTILRIEASIGIAFYPNDATVVPDLLEQADAAMYQAKRSDGHIALAAEGRPTLAA